MSYYSDGPGEVPCVDCIDCLVLWGMRTFWLSFKKEKEAWRSCRMRDRKPLPTLPLGLSAEVFLCKAAQASLAAVRLVLESP